MAISSSSKYQAVLSFLPVLSEGGTKEAIDRGIAMGQILDYNTYNTSRRGSVY